MSKPHIKLKSGLVLEADSHPQQESILDQFVRVSASMQDEDLAQMRIRVNEAASMAASGDKTINQCRAKLGLPPIAGGEQMPKPMVNDGDMDVRT